MKKYGEQEMTGDKQIYVDADKVYRWHDTSYTLRTLLKLSSYGSSELGFRLAGSDAEHETAEYIRDEFSDIGIDNVEIDRIDVDKWVLRDAYLEIIKPVNIKIQAASYAGSPPGDISAELVYGGRATASELSKLDVDGKIVLFDRQNSLHPSPSIPAYELLQLGAVGIVIGNLSYTDYSYMRDDAFYVADGGYSVMLPPILSISRRDSLKILKLLRRFIILWKRARRCKTG